MIKTSRSDIVMFLIGFCSLFGGFAIAISMIMADPKCRTSFCLDKPIGSPRYYLVLVSVYVFYGYILALGAATFVIRRTHKLDTFFRRRLSLPRFGSTSRRIHFSLSIGELVFVLSAAALLLWKFAYFAQWYFRNGVTTRPGQKWAASFFNLLTHALGHPLDVFIGFVLLPVSRHSPIASFLHIPFDGALRVHRIMGYAMFVWAAIHVSSFLAKTGLNGAQTYAKVIFGIGDPFKDLHDHMQLFGFLAMLSFILGFIPALPWLRRRHFNLFYIAHAFMLVMIAFAVVHSTTNFYYAVPGVILWTADLLLRARARMANPAGETHLDRVAREECGYIRMDIQTKTPFAFTPGQYVFINIPTLSPLEYHPFSISGSTTRSDTDSVLSLLIAASWKSTEWTNKLAARFVTHTDAEAAGALHNRVDAPAVVIEGPFGHCGFDVLTGNLDVVACFVSGSGVAPAFGLAHYVAAHILADGKKAPRKVLIFWATRAPYPHRTSFIADLYALFPPGVLEFHIFDTSHKEMQVTTTHMTTDNNNKPSTTALQAAASTLSLASTKSTPSHSIRTITAPALHPGVRHTPHRMAVPTVFDQLIRPHLGPHNRIGVFICANETLRMAIRDAVYETETLGTTVLVHEETYEF
ncbi:hypothetical protein PhCBS80983_g05875 [Powellomyces hirtus]|uniref:FAD-binding FR-type domain-containing protein n=1 Tax=Powellomyces hirtus TaxID=109895 RepID=A0A507DSR1_9FUNG|nr:hypothetical protein PhCBS80983_g05875 [Powellomyces hirtus]